MSIENSDSAPHNSDVARNKYKSPLCSDCKFTSLLKKVNGKCTTVQSMIAIDLVSYELDGATIVICQILLA